MDPPTIDLLAPMLASDFHSRHRLSALVMPLKHPISAAPEAPDIRLLSARKLIRYIDDGGRMRRRQQLEADGADLFLDEGTVRLILPELETTHTYKPTWPGVTALSYAWVRTNDPDPDRKQLLQLRPVLVYYLCERARRRLGNEVTDFGVFIGPALHRPKYLSPTPHSRHSSRRVRQISCPCSSPTRRATALPQSRPPLRARCPTSDYSTATCRQACCA